MALVSPTPELSCNLLRQPCRVSKHNYPSLLHSYLTDLKPEQQVSSSKYRWVSVSYVSCLLSLVTNVLLADFCVELKSCYLSRQMSIYICLSYLDMSLTDVLTQLQSGFWGRQLSIYISLLYWYVKCWMSRSLLAVSCYCLSQDFNLQCVVVLCHKPSALNWFLDLDWASVSLGRQLSTAVVCATSIYIKCGLSRSLLRQTV